MATRTTAVGTQSSSDYLTAAEYNDAAGGMIGQATNTSDQTGITTATDLTWSSISGAATLTLTPNSSRNLLIVVDITVSGNTNGDNFGLTILKDGSAVCLGQFGISSVDQVGHAHLEYLDVNPTNASHGYKVQLARTGSSAGTFAVRATTNRVGLFYICDMGPTF